MKKLFYSFILLMAVILSASVVANAETLNLVVDTKTVVYTDAYPFIENGRTMIPLRILSESMQATVEYDEKTSTVTITRDGNCTTTATYGSNSWSYIEYMGKKYEDAVATAIFTENSSEVIVELRQGKKLIHSTKTNMDVPAKIINGRTYIPARYVAYALGYGIYYDQERNRVLYQYKANQIADFESKAKYNHDYYKYNDLIMAGREAVTNYESWAYRDGYGNVKVVDGDNGWELLSGGKNERNYEMSNLLYMPINFTFETQEYKLSSKNTPEKNFKIFKEMLENKTTGEVTVSDGTYHLNINTYDELLAVKYSNGKYIIGSQKKINLLTGNGFPAAPRYGRYDYSMYYTWDDGEKFYYDSRQSSTVDFTASKYKLLFLETFLGEIGERIWTMMDDYYMHTGAFYVEEVCTGEGLYSYMSWLDPEINSEHTKAYGFDFIESKNNIEGYDSSKIITLKYEDFKFTIQYVRDGIEFPQVGYYVTFENLPE